MGTAVLGAGSWGTALAIQLARAGHAVSLWGRDAAHVADMKETRENRRYLAGFHLPPGLAPTANLEEAVRSATKLLVCAVPSHAVRETMTAAAPHLRAECIVVSAAKGIEEGTSKRMSEVIGESTSCGGRVAVLSGPSFAREVAAEMPTVVTAAASTESVAKAVQKGFASPMFRVYTTEDPIGVEIGASVKNVIAIAAGVSDGLGLGHNTRAAIITRGLAEVNRLACCLGADPLTVTGLAGMGDLVLTCTGELSRNRSVGIKLGQGEKLSEILAGMTQVAEGVRNTPVIHDLATAKGVDMPITAEMRCLLFENKSAREAMVDLMTRQLKKEFRS
ncbi:MAG: NAD(P)-dependent glycerol-3-phosphate dehydrogenase [Deltaproteobacteria bacterium]|nr:NAD(P)-dependent glycerol-3-phosphate dehydrogenase [Deltaproteobacteria bacterium]